MKRGPSWMANPQVKPSADRRRADSLAKVLDLGLEMLSFDRPESVWTCCRRLLDDHFRPESIVVMTDGDGDSSQELHFVHSTDPDWDDEDSLDGSDYNLTMPFQLEDGSGGNITLGSRRDAAPYNDEDLAFMGHFARLLGAALGIAQRSRLEARERRRLDRSLHTMSLLLDISKAVAAAHQLRSVLELILVGAIETVGAQKASLSLYDPVEDVLRIHLVKGLPDIEMEEAINSGRQQCMLFRPGEGIAGQVFATQKSMRISDTRQDARFKFANQSYTDSILCVPLIAVGEAVGVINVTNTKSDSDFDHADEDHLHMLASHAAGAINRAQLYSLATTDELTSLYTRRMVLQRLDQEVRRFHRYKRELSVAMIDVDYFKRVNDTHGHAAGDDVLRALGRILQEGTRLELDIPGRYGGEEFLLILPETTVESAIIACGRLREACEQERVVYDGEEIQFTISIGLTECTSHDPLSDTVIERADRALYAAKNGGRNKMVVFDGLDQEIKPE